MIIHLHTAKRITITLFVLCLLFTHAVNSQNTPTNNSYPGTASKQPGINKAPDCLFSASISGEVNQNIEFVLKGNIPNQYMINGNYLSSMNMFRVNISGTPQMLIGIGVMLPQMKPGIYKMNEQNQFDIGGYTNPQLSGLSFTSKSGSVTITKAEQHKSFTGTMDWFLDGSFEMMLQHGNDETKKITISGIFTGMGIKAN